MTVSRVVNAEPNVLAETRERVQAAIAQLGYVPNSAARNLAAGRHGRIALIHSNPSAAYLSAFLVGCLAEADASNVPLVVEHFAGGEAAEDLVRRIRSHRAHAVVVPAPLSNDARLIASLDGARLKLALVGAVGSVGQSVLIDDRSASTAMVEHLLALGHRRIGFITGAPDQASSALRREGYERALAAAGIDSLQEWVVEGDFTYRSGLVAAERLLELSDRPTAIFASNDDMAAAAVAVAHRHRLDVPTEMSVCGFDDTAMATTIWPELTTIRQPIVDMARTAVAALLRNAAPEAPIELPFELMVRGSTAAAPVRG